jgi:hypothetical protein
MGCLVTHDLAPWKDCISCDLPVTMQTLTVILL